MRWSILGFIDTYLSPVQLLCKTQFYSFCSLFWYLGLLDLLFEQWLIVIFIHSFIHLLILCSFVSLFLCSFVSFLFLFLLVHLFVCLCICSFILLFIRSFICLFVCSFVSLFVHLFFVCLFVCSFVCLFIYDIILFEILLKNEANWSTTSKPYTHLSKK